MVPRPQHFEHLFSDEVPSTQLPKLDLATQTILAEQEALRQQMGEGSQMCRYNTLTERSSSCCTRHRREGVSGRFRTSWHSSYEVAGGGHISRRMLVAVMLLGVLPAARPCASLCRRIICRSCFAERRIRTRAAAASLRGPEEGCLQQRGEKDTGNEKKAMDLNPPRGARLYPEEMALRNWLFGKMRRPRSPWPRNAIARSRE